MGATWDTIFRDSTRFWVQFVFVPVVVIIGVVGNSVTIYILTRKQMRISSKVYLTALTLSDLLFLLFSFSMSWKHYDCMKSVWMYWNYIPFGLWITDAASSTSIWLTVMFTIERYIAVCHPIISRNNSGGTKHRSFLVAICVYFTCFLLTFSKFFEWKAVALIDSNADTGKNVSTFILKNTDLGKNSWYRSIYRWFFTASFVIIPLLILLVGNVLLINAVRASAKIREGLISCYMHRRQAHKMCQQDRITINLIFIMVVFLICQLPTSAILIYTSMHTPLKDSVEENVLLGLGNLFNLLVTINAECNFILYTAISNRYRQSFLRLFGLRSIYNRWFIRKNASTTATISAPRVLSIREKPVARVLQSGENSWPRRSSSKTQKDQLNSSGSGLQAMRKCTTCEEIQKEARQLSVSSGNKCVPMYV